MLDSWSLFSDILLQILPFTLVGLVPILTYLNDKKSIRKVAMENMWWEVNIKKASKINNDRAYLVSCQDIKGNWISRYCVFTKTGMEWQEAIQKERR
jgi:hypothetical protein